MGKYTFFAILIAVVTGIYFAINNPSSNKGFVDIDLPLNETHRLFDIGIADVNKDGNLDIYTTNHHFRQVLLLSDGNGGYKDVLTKWGLDQSSAFPNAEISYLAPQKDKPGLYIYWMGSRVVISTHEMKNIINWSGALHTFNKLKIIKNDDFKTEIHGGADFIS